MRLTDVQYVRHSCLGRVVPTGKSVVPPCPTNSVPSSPSHEDSKEVLGADGGQDRSVVSRHTLMRPETPNLNVPQGRKQWLREEREAAPCFGHSLLSSRVSEMK